jgi:hypothetical protein
MAGLVLIYGAEHFAIFEETPARDLPPSRLDAKEFDHLGRAWAFGLMGDRSRISLILAVAVSLGMGFFTADAMRGIELERSPVSPPRAQDETRSVLLIDGDRDGDAVAFKHASHKEKLGGEASCRKCHHLDMPNDPSSSCSHCHRDMRLPTSIFDHDLHVAEHGDKWSCDECHSTGEPKSSANAKACHECHEEDMGLKAPASGTFNHKADGHVDAMHEQCIGCHEKQDAKAHENRMAECAFCHARDETRSVRKTRPEGAHEQ